MLWLKEEMVFSIVHQFFCFWSEYSSAKQMNVTDGWHWINGASWTMTKPCRWLCQVCGQGTFFPFPNYDCHWFLFLKAVTVELGTYLTLVYFFLWCKGLGNSITFYLVSLSYLISLENQNILWPDQGLTTQIICSSMCILTQVILNISPKHNMTSIFF